jgi:truncated hemoglobin YjbI
MGEDPLAPLNVRAAVERVVEAFYTRATTDVLIGYHFRHIEDFSTHLPRIRAFWELQLLGDTAIPLEGPLDALRAHIPLKLHRGELDRWVKLFKETLLSEGVDPILKVRWEEKLARFQEVFAASPLLFPARNDGR